jgi:tryptophanyl-tRNA synthetase
MRIFSGIQPSQSLHIGNYFGAIKQWLIFQKNYNTESIFFIADLHCLTSESYKKFSIYEKSLEVLANYIACGLDSDKNIFFLQSKILNHVYFFWILCCITQIGELNRMVQMKDKCQKYNNSGILMYPVLMASDILLYNPDYVPVGQDQYQHLELARDLAIRLNHCLNEKIFKLPYPFKENINPIKIYDLTDGSKKMSKSNEKGCIFLTDSDEIIRQKIMKAKSDNFFMPLISDNYSGRLEIVNLLNIYSYCTNESLEQVIKKFENQPIGNFKKELVEVMIKTISPIRQKIHQLLNEKIFLENILKDGEIWANKESDKIIKIINNYFLKNKIN